MFGNSESWIRDVAPFLFYFLDVVYVFLRGIGVNDFAVKDCTTWCLVNSFKFSIPLHFSTLLGIDPPHFAIKAAAKHTHIPHYASVCIGVFTFCHESTHWMYSGVYNSA
jgi:hypothetical protein